MKIRTHLGSVRTGTGPGRLTAPPVGGMASVMILSSLIRALSAFALPPVRSMLWRSLALTLLLFGALGVGLWFGLAHVFRHFGWTQGEGWAGAALALLIALAGAWLLFRAVAMAIVSFFADTIVIAIERTDYPDRHAMARPVPFARSMRVALRSVLRMIGWNLVALPLYALLLVTGVGAPLLFLLLNAYLLGRDLADLVEGRHPERPPLTAGQRWQVGFVSALLFLPPVVNLLAPVWSVAMATHMFHGRRDEVTR